MVTFMGGLIFSIFFPSFNVSLVKDNLVRKAAINQKFSLDVILPAIPQLKSCRRNPYLTGWDGEEFAEAADAVSEFRSTQNAGALDNFIHHHDPAWLRFNASPKVLRCQGLGRFPESDASSDGGKWLCGIKNLQSGCIVYSLGSNANFDFEFDIIAATPCVIYTFDCTVSESEERFPKDLLARGQGRIFFYPWCVGESGGRNGNNYFSLIEIASKLKHNKIDLLKMDIEGYEYRVVESIFAGALKNSLQDFLPMQVSFEMHAWDPRVSEPAAAIRNGQGLSAGDMQVFWTQLTELGYVPVSREDNPLFSMGVEFTVVRAFC